MPTIEPVSKTGKLVLYVRTGTSATNNPIYSSRTFANVQSLADDQDVYEVALALSELMEHNLVDVNRIEISSLVVIAP